MPIVSKDFGRTGEGQRVTAFTLCNENGMSVSILDYGCTIQSITVPDHSGTPTDVVLGYDDTDSYEKGTCYYGAIIGRYANRIKDACFTLEEKVYQLTKNDGNNHLHGVFSKRVFDASWENDVLFLRYVSPDMEEGYPGNLSVEIGYRLCDDNSLEITYRASTDAPTVLNLTNHSYFNLNGQNGSTILDHSLRLNSRFFTELSGSFTPTGRILSVENTPFDFRKEEIIGARFNNDHQQLKMCSGYDHNMILEGKENELKLIGTAKSAISGICMEAFTTEPSVQFYTGNYLHLDPVPHGKNSVRYPKQGGFCLEAQHYPDSVHHPHFPDTVLLPGEIYNQTTVYRFNRN